MWGVNRYYDERTGIGFSEIYINPWNKGVKVFDEKHGCYGVKIDDSEFGRRVFHQFEHGFGLIDDAIQKLQELLSIEITLEMSDGYWWLINKKPFCFLPLQRYYTKDREYEQRCEILRAYWGLICNLSIRFHEEESEDGAIVPVSYTNVYDGSDSEKLMRIKYYHVKKTPLPWKRGGD